MAELSLTASKDIKESESYLKDNLKKIEVRIVDMGARASWVFFPISNRVLIRMPLGFFSKLK